MEDDTQQDATTPAADAADDVADTAAATPATPAADPMAPAVEPVEPAEGGDADANVEPSGMPEIPGGGDSDSKAPAKEETPAATE